MKRGHLIRARQPALTRFHPHNANARYLIPRVGARPLPPVVDPPSGAVAAGTNVTLTSPEGYPIFFTANGSFPGDAVLYTGPISIVGDTTITAVCKRPGGMPSEPITASYTIAAATDRLRWEFDASLDGWSGYPPATLTLGVGGPGTARLDGVDRSMRMQRTIVSSGQTGAIWRYFQITGTKVSDPSGSGALQYSVQWANANHGLSGQYGVSLLRTIADGAPFDLTYDMWSATEAADWKGSDILNIYWGGGNLRPIFDIAWIEVRKEGSPV